MNTTDNKNNENEESESQEQSSTLGFLHNMFVQILANLLTIGLVNACLMFPVTWLWEYGIRETFNWPSPTYLQVFFTLCFFNVVSFYRVYERIAPVVVHSKEETEEQES